MSNIEMFCKEHNITIADLEAIFQIQSEREKVFEDLNLNGRSFSDLALGAIAHLIEDVLTVNLSEGVRVTIRRDVVYPWKDERYKLYHTERLQDFILAGAYCAAAIEQLRKA